MSEFSRAKQLFDHGRSADAERLVDQLLETSPDDALLIQLKGVLRYQGGDTAGGLALAEKAVASDPSCGEAWDSLGLMRYLAGNEAEALRCFERSCAATPGLVQAWIHRGFILGELGRHEEALEALRHPIPKGNDHADLHFFLGKSLAALALFEDALARYERALAIYPQYVEALINGSATLYQLGRFAEAQQWADRALRAGPGAPLAIINKARALHGLGRTAEALNLLASVRSAEAHQARAQILEQVDRLREASSAFLEASKKMPDDLGAAARVLMEDGSWRAGQDLLSRRREPQDLLLEAVMLPVILAEKGEADMARQKMASGLDKVSGTISQPLLQVSQTTFYLAYHGKGERELQERVAQTYLQTSPQLQFNSAGSSRSGRGRKRIGVVSAFLKKHTIGKLFGNTLARLEPEFEVIFFRIGSKDDLSEQISSMVSKTVPMPMDLSLAQQMIAREELDVLIFPEVGMDTLTYYLSFCRFAPVQIALWGHPMTTGSPTMDYFISSEHMERPGGEVEYSEQLVRLPSLTTYFAKPPQPSRSTRTELGLPEGKRLYSCPQTLFKFHPDFDRVLSDILERDPEGQLVLLEPKRANWKRLILKRWKGTPMESRTTWLPGMSLPDFLRLCQLSDAVLDPIQFGGGNSTLECLGVGVPVVTLPGGLLRNRITLQIYRQMEMSDLIAEDESSYAAMAITLATDAPFRRAMQEKVRERSAVLFENQRAVDELAQFLHSVA